MEHARRAAYLRALNITAYQPRAAVRSVPGRPSGVEPKPPVDASARGAGLPATVTSQQRGDGLETLRRQVAECRRCTLCQTRTQTVFAAGSPKAELMVVGEGPGAEEDAKGFPFVGRAGRLLDEMLRAIGRCRDVESAEQGVYIANVVKCRPPGNRDPRPEEVEACKPYLDRQVELVRPKLIVALGRVAAQRLLRVDLPMAKLRGNRYEYGVAHTPVVPTYHPAYLLRSPLEKAKAWRDLKRIDGLLRSES